VRVRDRGTLRRQLAHRPCLAAPLPPVRVLGIDETRRGKPIWAQGPDTKRWVLACDRWHTGFVDAAGTGGLLAQVEAGARGRSGAGADSPRPGRSCDRAGPGFRG
jgi:hypothetical protein